MSRPSKPHPRRQPPAPDTLPHPGLVSDADILASAHVSDKVPRHILDELPPQHAATLTRGRLLGGRLVYVHWLTGECALMFCAPGSNMPVPSNVIRGYRENPMHQKAKGEAR